MPEEKSIPMVTPVQLSGSAPDRWHPNPEHLAKLMEGVDVWNDWRRQNPHVMPILRKASLSKADLNRVDLSNADLAKSKLREADLRSANLYQAELFGVDLRSSNLSGADVRGAKLHNADLRAANLQGSDLFRADFINTKLSKARFNQARCMLTAFSNVSLSEVIGLDEVRHTGPSNIDVATLFRLKNPIPEIFLRGAGVPDNLIHYIPTLIASEQATQFYSCFISYSHKDEEFAKRLYSRLRDVHIRVWFAPEDIRGGEKIHEQVDSAIQIYDKLLVVLSEHSLQSEWVMTEIRKARRSEIREGRRKLFPIRMVSFDKIREWECFDSDSGKDMAVEVREYFMPDFSNWRGNNDFEAAFNRLLRDLRAAVPIGRKI